MTCILYYFLILMFGSLLPLIEGLKHNFVVTHDARTLIAPIGAPYGFLKGGCFGFDVVDGVRGLDIEGDGLASKGLDKDLHTTTQAEHQVESRFLLDIVIRESASIFQLLSSKNQTLLVWRNTFLVLNFGFYILDGVRRLNVQGYSFARQGFDEDLHGVCRGDRSEGNDGARE